MDMEIVKKYLPEGKTHITDQVFSDEELAGWVDALFMKKVDREYQTEKEEAIHYLMEKEIAYQVIKRLAGDKRIPCVIQNEKDWKRYFQLPDQDDP